MEGKTEVGPFQLMSAITTTAVLIGANVGGKANYMAIAWCAPCGHTPPSFMFAANKTHHTNKGIIENRSFSINIPSVDQVKLLDWCGLNSGAEVDKSALCNNFYGVTHTAPMMPICPVCVECSLIEHHDMNAHTVFMGKVEKVYANPDILVQGPHGPAIDTQKLHANMFSFSGPSYMGLLAPHAVPWSVGAEFDPKDAAPARRSNEFPRIDTALCVGCGNCVGSCPKSLYSLNAEGKSVFDMENISQCTHCHHCIEGCPVNAISLSHD
ncbi:putative flavin reductase family protein [Paratrimastix pyriformis]|uniref:Flavin reductase family protein n=1 Tax=Paratrimastix pyriformis TaxID=342808 RepID=A0ABQ8UPC1_9EUKA|nr:putative flavin reductase family protein [Paratrimastix pyriformis]